MNDFPGNEFRPKQPLTKAQALVVLMRGLNMDYNPRNCSPQLRCGIANTATNGDDPTC